MRSLRSPVPTCALRCAAYFAFSSATFRSSRRERRTFIALALFFCCERSSAQRTIAARLVENLHGGIRRVHALAAGAGRAANGDFQFLRLDFHVHLLRFGQHGDGAGAGMNAALRFGRGHALDAMHAAFVFEPLKTSVPVTEKMISLKPPRSDGLESIVSTFQPRASA